MQGDALLSASLCSWRLTCAEARVFRMNRTRASEGLVSDQAVAAADGSQRETVLTGEKEAAGDARQAPRGRHSAPGSAARTSGRIVTGRSPLAGCILKVSLFPTATWPVPARMCGLHSGSG